jgi:hypothetical protein
MAVREPAAGVAASGGAAQVVEAIKPWIDQRKNDGGIKRVGLNRGAAVQFRLWGLKGAAQRRGWRLFRSAPVKNPPWIKFWELG